MEATKNGSNKENIKETLNDPSSQDGAQNFSAENKSPIFIVGVTAIVTTVLVLLIIWGWTQFNVSDQQKQPLYWVSQMDANYRSSAPGKCPHGMDLVPVYAEDLTAANNDLGVVQITPGIQQQLGVRTAIVETGRLKQILRTYGRVMPDPNLMVKLSPRVEGWVDMLFVTTAGEPVTRGQPLYAIYSPQLIAVQERYLKIKKGRDLAKLAEAESELRALNMDDTAIAQLNKDGVAQQSVVFRAAQDGMVDMLSISEGDHVEPGDSLMMIGAMDKVVVELDVFESQAALIQPQQAIAFSTLAHPGFIWQSEVDYIYPGLDKKSRALRFRAQVDNTDMRLLPHMQVQAFIALPERPPALLVPRQAVIHIEQRDRVVLDMGEGRFKSVAVTLGESNNEQVEITQGLREGDVVVVSAQFLIDSESSKTSDFNRIEGPTAASQYPPTWVNAVIKEVNLAERKLRLQHEPIADWQMPGMTMNFKVAAGLNMQNANVDDHVRVRIADGEPLFEILDMQPLAAGQAP